MRPYLLLTLLPFVAPSSSCLLEIERQGGHYLSDPAIQRRQEGIPPNATIPIGTGDRFSGGKLFPRGLGSQPPGTRTSTILNLGEIRSGLLGLVKEFGLQLVESPIKTYEKRTFFGAKIGKGPITAYIETGIHSRERGGPDHVLYFMSDLLWAKREGKGLTYGGVSYSYDQVVRALSVGIVFFPVVNPDGVAYDQSTSTCWRKNRNPASAKPSDPNTIGVDLNRNFDFLWDFPKYFAPGIEPASMDPASVAFAGTGPFSEAETKSIKWALDEFKDLRWFVDIHSHASRVLYPWGDDSNQITNPAQTYSNRSWDGTRGVIPDGSLGDTRPYQAYMAEADKDLYTVVSGNMVNRIFDATLSTYLAHQVAHLYPTSGSSADYAYIRHMEDKKKSKIYGFGLEFGHPNELHPCTFYPTLEIHNNNTLEVGVALMEYLLGAAKFKGTY